MFTDVGGRHCVQRHCLCPLSTHGIWTRSLEYSRRRGHDLWHHDWFAVTMRYSISNHKSKSQSRAKANLNLESQKQKQISNLKSKSQSRFSNLKSQKQTNHFFWLCRHNLLHFARKANLNSQFTIVLITLSTSLSLCTNACGKACVMFAFVCE